MREESVQLLCPNCEKTWDDKAQELPALETTFECPDCGERRPLSEFTRTSRDIETLRQF